MKGLTELTSQTSIIKYFLKDISHCKVPYANPSVELNKRVKMKCHIEEIKYRLYLNDLFLMTAP